MTSYSIYHFFLSLIRQKHLFKKLKRLDKFPFDKKLLSCRNVGAFPDLAIRLNKDRKKFTGGELVELKDCNLNSEKYPEIRDNTVNLVIACHNEEEERHIRKKLEDVFFEKELREFEIFKIKHHFNGHFLVLQTNL